jgi:hypothetical protein
MTEYQIQAMSRTGETGEVIFRNAAPGSSGGGSVRAQRVMERYGCSSETAWRYLDLRDEGYPQYQAALMAGLTDPEEAA